MPAAVLIQYGAHSYSLWSICIFRKHVVSLRVIFCPLCYFAYVYHLKKKP